MQVIQIEVNKAESIINRIEAATAMMLKAAEILKREEVPMQKKELMQKYGWKKGFYDKWTNPNSDDPIPYHLKGRVKNFYASEVNAWVRGKNFENEELG